MIKITRYFKNFKEFFNYDFISNFSNKKLITKLQRNTKQKIQNKKINPLELKMYPVEVKSTIKTCFINQPIYRAFNFDWIHL